MGRVTGLLDRSEEEGVGYSDAVRADNLLETLGFPMGSLERLTLLACVGARTTFAAAKEAIQIAFPIAPPAPNGFAPILDDVTGSYQAEATPAPPTSTA